MIMSEYKAEISWKRTTPQFEYDTYDRTHEVMFAGGQKYTGSAAPEFKGIAAHANPEEALAASASACHMLTFLAICARGKIIVNSYHDQAVAHLDKNADGKLAVVKITLKPEISFEGTAPDAAKLKALHEKAHANCFIANSLNFPVEII